MSLSKVYKVPDAFIPEQILPRQGTVPEPVWQDMVSGHTSRSQSHASFTPDSTTGRGMASATHHFTEPHGDREGVLSPEALSEAETNREETAAAAIELEKIRQQAFTEGVLEGRRQADEDFGTSALTLQTACTQLALLHETILRNNLDEMHNLVMEIAAKIIRHSVQEQSETILSTIEDAIRLAVKSEEFQIRVNPEDLEIIKQKKNDIINEISGLDNIILKGDTSIDRGGCLLESANCTVDATINGQLQVIKEALQSEQPAATSFPGEP